MEVEGIDVSSDSTQQLSLSVEAPRLNVETPGAALQSDCVAVLCCCTVLLDALYCDCCCDCATAAVMPLDAQP